MMIKDKQEWLPLDTAAERFGYRHRESLRRRLRQLRSQGYVVDTGRPPNNYPIGDARSQGKIVLLWPNPKTALMRSDPPIELLDPKPGKRSTPKRSPHR